MLGSSTVLYNSCNWGDRRALITKQADTTLYNIDGFISFQVGKLLNAHHKEAQAYSPIGNIQAYWLPAC